MGMYTELIFGASLKKDTPQNVIDALKYMVGDLEEKPENFPLPGGRCEWLLKGSSCYFGISYPFSFLRFDDISQEWMLSSRSNIKNYNGEIETFLGWIKPYIDKGSGYREMYAVVIYEEASTPDLYYLLEE